MPASRRMWSLRTAWRGCWCHYTTVSPQNTRKNSGMNQKMRAEFEKLSKADQEWVLEVLRLLGMLTEDQQQAAVGFCVYRSQKEGGMMSV